MECMRALIERDRQTEGAFTGYCGPLERVVLKKDRFLGEPGEPPAKAAAPAPVVRPEQAVHPLFSAADPRSSSIFGDKLQQALRPADTKPEE